MKSTFILLILFCIQYNFSQTQHYQAPLIEISDFKQNIISVGHDFGYMPIQKYEMEKGYYIWIENQWYYILNASSVFKTNNNKLTFVIDFSKKPDLKIRDLNGAVFSYPIQALEEYKISFEEFRKTQEEVVEKQETFQKISNLDVPSDSNLLDVIKVEEVEIKTIVPYQPQQENKNDNKQTTTLKEIIQAEVSTEETKKIETNQDKPNAYELAVSKGFDGTVTEWFESETAKNGISPFQQAQKEGFDGTEEEFLQSLWGSGFDEFTTAKQKEAKYVLEWINKIKTSDGEAPYEHALKHGFYGSFTEWVESVIGTDGEKVYNEEVKKGYKGTYKNWLEEKLNASNDELKRRERLKKQNFLMVPQIQLSLNENPEEVSSFNLFNYYKIYFGESVISSESSYQTVDVTPEDIEYQITWFNKNEVSIQSISSDGIVKYKKNPTFLGNSTQINVRFIIK
ncbi:hypothetical protein AB4865_01980 [Capnocytophaga sp. ARDL2]|uniref:hypothetical protein n=1 Tax=Capnocytophaga sp. ARDL2 TaxID=3238809 RepID=UPI003558F9A2